MTLPSMFYLMHLASGANSESDRYETWGASMPGLPCIQLGQNRWIAWGITAALCDDVELYRERIHRIELDRYLAGEEWRKFAERRELIGIRGGKNLERIVRSSRHGAIISDFSGIDKSGEVLALRWCATEASQESHSVYRLNQARDWQEFLTALSYYSAPSLNFVYADHRGNIGYALAGKIPNRSVTENRRSCRSPVGTKPTSGVAIFHSTNCHGCTTHLLVISPRRTTGLSMPPTPIICRIFSNRRSGFAVSTNYCWRKKSIALTTWLGSSST